MSELAGPEMSCLDLPAPHLVMMLAPGVAAQVQSLDESPLHEVVAMLLAPWDYEEATDADVEDRAADLGDVNRFVQADIVQAVRASTLVAVLELVRRGYSTRQIAYRLGITTQAFNKRFGSTAELVETLRAGGRVMVAIRSGR